MKPYAVEVSFTMIVMAEDETEAYHVADENAREAWGDTQSPDYMVLNPVTSEEQLKFRGWDGNCIPYGGDGDTRLKDIIANLEPELVRDDKTVDMFAESQ